MRLFKTALYCFLAVLMSGGAFAIGLRLTGNIHPIVPHEAYRSAQLPASHLTALVAEDGIKTVINLRGSNPDQDWYRAEHDAMDKAGVTEIDLPLSANEEPDDTTLRHLIAALRQSQRPLLIHCEAGADRSGLASALYRLIIVGDTAEDAAQQLSLRYGHFPWLWSRTGAMDRAFERVAQQPERFITP